MAKNLTTINEAQSKAYLQSIEKIKSALIKDMGLSNVEASYVTNFYTAIKESNLFTSNYFKDFDVEGEKFNLNDIQKFTKYPESFYDVVMHVFHSKDFSEDYDIKFDGVDVQLHKKEKKLKKKSFSEETPYDKFKVAEDENYYTFLLTNYSLAKEMRTFYHTMYPKDKDITAFEKMFYADYCIWSTKAKSYFKNQKHSNSDVWLMTFLKQNPAEMLRKHFNVDSLKGNKKTEEFLYKPDKGEFYDFKNQLGELYLAKADGSIGSGANYAYHNYSNSPASGVEETALNIPISYSYEEAAQKAAEIIKNEDEGESTIVIEDGVLVSYDSKAKIANIPNGVSTIAKDAFKNLNNLVQVSLPISVKKIESGAFSSLPKLQIVKVHNTLEVIESGAFENCKIYNMTMLDALKDSLTWRDLRFNSGMFFAIGVIDKQKTGITILKPSQLRYAPRDMLKAMKKMQAIASGDKNEK